MAKTPRIVLLAVTLTLVACAPRSPTATPPSQAAVSTPTPPSSPTPDVAPSPTATKEPTATATSETTPTPESATVTPEPVTPTPGEVSPTTEPEEATPIPEPEDPQEYVVLQQITGYSSPGGEEIGYIVPGKKFTILKEEDGWLYIRLEAGGEGWIQVSETAYTLAGEVPPSPAVCEVPHFPDRTPDRKTGYIIALGEYQPRIYEPGVNHWIKYPPNYVWVTKRDGRITEIDRENQIITFDVGTGASVQRRFIESTEVVMYAHELYRGMPMNQAIQTGGNLCDLEVGDAASILHPGEPEGTSPSPEGELWDVLIVQ